MRRHPVVAIFAATIVLAAAPVAAQPILNVNGAGLIELIEIGSSTGVIGHKDDAVLRLGDATDDEVQIRAGLSDSVSLWVNQNVEALKIDSLGIMDINRQSRTRWSLSTPQPIPQAVWIPIEYDFDPTFADADHFDEHLESVPGPGVPWTFVATKTGYYQVNARIEFENVRQEDPGQPDQLAPVPPPGPPGGFSIAIFKTDPTGGFAIHSQGNNLQYFQILLTIPEPTELRLDANNAPNVSDVVFLRVGEAIQIHAWWDAGFVSFWTADLAKDKHKTYVSVHKLS